MLELRGLTKRYDDVTAVDHISVTVRPAQGFSVLNVAR